MRILFLCLILFPISLNAADLSLNKSADSCEVLLTGPIISGDYQKLSNIVEECRAIGSDYNKIILDGSGADFLEGINIGQLIFNNGWATSVLQDGVCDGACAFAFLGGRFFGTSIGWGTSRNMEFGATLGFKPLYGDTTRRATYEKKPSFDQSLLLALLEYLQKIKISPEFAITLLRLDKSDTLYINTPALLKMLAINVYKVPGSLKEFLSTARATDLAKTLLIKRQPYDWEFNPKSANISAFDFKKELLGMVAIREKGDGDELFPLSKEINKALKTQNTRSINELFDELNSLRVTPITPGKDAHIIKITGLDNIHYYLSKTAYFFIYNDGTPQINVDYVFFGPPETSWDVFSGSIKKYGELMYDLYEPDINLWQVGDGN